MKKRLAQMPAEASDSTEIGFRSQPRREAIWMVLAWHSRFVVIIPDDSGGHEKNPRVPARAGIPAVGERLFGRDSDSQVVTSFGPSCLDDPPAARRAHSLQEPVRSGSFSLFRLISAFHR